MGLRLRKEDASRRDDNLPERKQNDEVRKKGPTSWLTRFFVGVLALSIVFLLRHEYEPSSDNSVQPRTSLFTSTKQGVRKDKNGRLVHKSITAVKKGDLAGLVDFDMSDNAEITYDDAIKGREKLVDLLHDAGVEELDIETVLMLPKWSSVTKLYGEGPVVIGLDTCERFRNTATLDDASIGTAGLFNTGTNPFAMYIEANCKMPHNTHDKHGGTRWQVPWGKHMLASRRMTNTAGNDHKVNKTNVMPIVLVRDPYSWMQSMCKNPYQARWHHVTKHCPNLVPNAVDLEYFPHQTDSIPVNVKYDPPVQFKSLVHYWSEWYRQYYDADFPRLIVRFEDLQFHPKEMIDIVCQCAGAVPKDEGKFEYIVDSAKWGPGHKGKQTNLISAMIKYGTDKKRFVGMTKEDLEFASNGLDLELMQLFQYEMPTL